MENPQQLFLPTKPNLLSRRRFVTGVAAGSALMGCGLASELSYANPGGRTAITTLTGRQFDLNIGYQTVNFTGKERQATVVNGSLPAPILRWREGDRVTLRVTNNLAHDTSIHWHGMILPADMDGVPGISFDGIRPGESFTYTVDVRQNGTYW